MNLELQRVTPTDDIYKSGGLWRVMQPWQEYLWPASAVSSLTVEGLQRGAKYFEDSETATLLVTPTTNETVREELRALWRATMKTDPDKYIKDFDLNTNGLARGAYQPPNAKIWKGQPLNGKRVLLCGAYSIGDQLWYTHTLALIKKKYPRATLYTLTYAGYGDGLWAGNSEVNEIQLPVTPSAFEAFDYYIPLLSIVASQIDPAESRRQKKLVRSQRTPYEDFADMLGMMKIYDPADAKPRLYLDDADWRAMCIKITVNFFDAWGTAAEPIEPRNYLVVQLHTQKESRDFTPSQLVDILTELRKEYSHSLIFCIGDGEKGIVTWNAITDELDPEALKIVPIINGTQSGGYTFREVAALAAHSMLCVTPDSMLSHVAAAFDVPCVAVYGPYSAAWRAVTYKYCVSIDKSESCAVAPCAWPGSSFPEACPSRAEKHCAVVAAATGADVLAAAASAIAKKREDAPDWGEIRMPKVETEGTLKLVEEEVNA